MRPLTANLLLALVWVGLTGAPSGGNLACGFVLGWAALWLAREALGAEAYFARAARAAELAAFAVKELLVSNLRLAWDAVTPRHRMRPGIAAIEVAGLSDLELMAAATLITLTPGTLCLDLSDDRSTLYVHALYPADADELRRSLRRGYIDRIRGAAA